MHAEHFSPWGTDQRPCWHCTQYAGTAAGGSAALCSLPGGPRVRATPSAGCSAFEREVGADDEPGPPAAGADRPIRFSA
jgi:hypothetical protein